VTYEDWELSFPAALKTDLIWRVQAYRLASFIGDCAEADTRSTAHDPRFVPLGAQLCRAVCSIAANIAEGYSRKSARDRVRYYEYAVCSANETKVWYLRMRTEIDQAALDARIDLLQSITRLLLTMIRSSRS
jgi:four helix bundle protein